MTELTSVDENQLMPVQELNLQEALELAVYLQQQNRHTEAQNLFIRILEVDPDNPDALHYYGIIKYFLGDKEAGTALIEKALSIAPDYVQAHNNLGNMYLQQRQFEKAEASYRKVIEINPNFKTAYNNLGITLKESGRIVEAIDILLKAIHLDPYAMMHYQNLGNVFKQKGELANAMDVYLEALSQRPFKPDTYRHLSYSLKICGEDDRAVQILRKLLEIDPDNSLARHTLSAYTGEDIPARADDHYVRATFDRFAESFDGVLKTLDYKAPFLVDKAFQGIARQDSLPVVLDAGCGTGLCGPLLRPKVKHLIGVDLSPAMLARASERQVYDELVEAELTSYLNQSVAAFDAIVSADVLCYFGELTEVFACAAKAIKPDGYLIFTVEKLEDDKGKPFQLHTHGRYSHCQAYIKQCLTEANLSMLDCESTILRLEMGEPVAGFLVTAHKNGG